MENLIEIVNKLQNIFTLSGCEKVHLPQIVVLGTQSSGKSSVLEHLVGRSFLPRGAGLVTRCPLIIQMSKVDKEDYALFLHDPTTTYTDYALITKEIENETERLAGENKGICSTPITVNLFSPDFVNLTLVDLPGLTKVPVGEQPADIENQTKRLVMDYIKNDNTIILAVIPANIDIATSESLKIAKEVDPDGQRTLAVVTKLDLMDEGTDALDILNGVVIPVKLGIIGVVNRSQKNINEEKTIEESLADEAKFFKINYRNIAYEHGTPYLKKTVQKILINYIKESMPRIKNNVIAQLSESHEDLKSLGETTYVDSTLLVHLLLKFNNTFSNLMMGKLTNIETSKLEGGARISNIFETSLVNVVNSFEVRYNFPATKAKTMMQNASGTNPPLLPEIVFEQLVKKEIEKLRAPCLECVNSIHNELIVIIKSCVDDPNVGLGRFPKLQHRIYYLAIEFLAELVPLTKEKVTYFIDVQVGFINKEHPQLKNGLDKIIFGDNYTNRGLNNQTLLESLVVKYFHIVRNIVNDSVTKMIMHSMVNYTVENLHVKLLDKILDSAKEYLEESLEVRRKRERLMKDVEALEQANMCLGTLWQYFANIE